MVTKKELLARIEALEAQMTILRTPPLALLPSPLESLGIYNPPPCAVCGQTGLHSCWDRPYTSIGVSSGTTPDWLRSIG